MVSLVFIGIFVLAALAAAGTAFVVKSETKYGDSNPKVIAGSISASMLVLALLTWLISSSFVVEARTVGIVTEFGQATGTVQPGYNFLPPWASVTEFPTSTQPLDLNGKDGNEGGAGVPVKFTGGGQGWVNLNVNWKVKGNDEAIKLWNEWKDFDKVTQQVVVPRVRSYASVAAGVYKPAEAINSENNTKMATTIKDKLNDALNSKGIEVTDVNVGGVDVDPDTQKRINSQAQKQTDLDNATLEQQKAVVDNKTKQDSQALLTPAALVDQCLKMVDSWDVAKSGPLPAGFNCFGGSNVDIAALANK